MYASDRAILLRSVLVAVLCFGASCSKEKKPINGRYQRQIVGDVLSASTSGRFVGFDGRYAFGGADTGMKMTKPFMLKETKGINSIYRYLTGKNGWRDLTSAVTRDGEKINNNYAFGISLLVQFVPFKFPLQYNYAGVGFFNSDSGVIYWCSLDSGGVSKAVMDRGLIDDIVSVVHRKPNSVVDPGTPGNNCAFISIVYGNNVYSSVAALDHSYSFSGSTYDVNVDDETFRERVALHKVIWGMISASDSSIPRFHYRE